MKQGHKNVQNVVPSGAPAQDGHLRLVIPDGPWNGDVWQVIPPSTTRRIDGEAPCCVRDCDNPGRGESSLCVRHHDQWYREGKPDDPRAWARSAQPIKTRKPRKSSQGAGSIDFTALPTPLAAEIRYVVGTKFARGDWSANPSLYGFLRLLIDVARRYRMSSFLDRRIEEWHLLLRQSLKVSDATYGTRHGPSMRTFYSTLSRALVADPWAEDVWPWLGLFETILPNAAATREQGNARWDLVSAEWLRTSAKELAKQALVTGQRKWSTIQSWVQALRLLDTYLVQEGLSEPAALDREAFLDFLAWVRETRNTKHNLMLVTTAATILETLRGDGLVPDLGSPVYLRRGENTVKKVRSPRPFPADVITLVDQRIIPDPALDDTARIMLRFTRWAGPRISELVAMPIDVLRRTQQGSYWVEYYMNKTDTWRRFPVPDDLGQAIREQQGRVRATFGDSARHLFPGRASKPNTGVTVPWLPSSFRAYIREQFVKHGITRSTVTGETISGGEIHRFRHTVGTALINNNWAQPEVQEFLGHGSATMTSHYAEINDDTLARKAAEFHRSQNDHAPVAGVEPSVERLRAKFAVVLPNGGCALPANMKCEFRPNPCLSCSFFRPDGEGALEANEAHRKRLKLIIAEAREAGDQAVLALNQPMLDQLDQILDDQDQENTGA